MPNCVGILMKFLKLHEGLSIAFKVKFLILTFINAVMHFAASLVE